MSDLGLALPLRIERGEESVRVVDRTGKVAAYIYVCAERERRLQMNRMSPEEGAELAKFVARTLTDRLTGA